MVLGVGAAPIERGRFAQNERAILYFVIAAKNCGTAVPIDRKPPLSRRVAMFCNVVRAAATLIAEISDLA